MQIHGGDIYSNPIDLDFSANINPLGMPQSIKEAAIRGIKASIHYPDIAQSKLREAIARKETLPKEYIICGNGAADLIFSLCLAVRPKKALLLSPTFIEYEQALKAVDCKTRVHVLKKDNGFRLQEDFLDELTSSVDLVFLCNPNNPTGEIIRPSLLDAIIDRCVTHRILLVIDECFQDFLSEEVQDIRTGVVTKTEYVFLLRAFTKMYGMAGLRLGYGLTSNEELLRQMKAVSQPWNVSIPAQFAGIAACNEEDFVKKSREYIAKERELLIAGLTKLGFSIYGSKANYIFFEGRTGLYEECLKRRVLIRSCSNYKGLDDTFYRIAVRSEVENQQLLHLLEEITCKGEDHGYILEKREKEI